MTILARLILLLLVLAGLAYGALWALANLVEPEPREVVIQVPPSRFAK